MYIYLQEGDRVEINYAYDSTIVNGDDSWCNTTGESTLPIHNLKLYDTNGKVVARATTTSECSNASGVVSSAINYTATETGTYTFTYEDEKSTSLENSGIMYQVQTYSGENKTPEYGNVWLKEYNINKTTRAITDSVYAVLATGSSYEVGLEEFISNGSTITMTNSIAPIAIEMCKNITGNIENCNINTENTVNIFIDKPSDILPATSQNPYTGEEISSFIKPQLDSIGIANISEISEVSSDVFSITGYVDNYNGFMSLGVDYNGDKIIDQEVIIPVVNGVINYQWTNKTDIVLDTTKATVTTGPIAYSGIKVSIDNESTLSAININSTDNTDNKIINHSTYSSGNFVLQSSCSGIELQNPTQEILSDYAEINKESTTPCEETTANSIDGEYIKNDSITSTTVYAFEKNTSTHQIEPQKDISLSITNSKSDNVITAGETVEYKLNITNNSDKVITDLLVTNPSLTEDKTLATTKLAENVTVELNGRSLDVNIVDQKVTIPEIKPGETVTITYSLTFESLDEMSVQNIFCIESAKIEKSCSQPSILNAPDGYEIF